MPPERKKSRLCDEAQSVVTVAQLHSIYHTRGTSTPSVIVVLIGRHQMSDEFILGLLITLVPIALLFGWMLYRDLPLDG